MSLVAFKELNEEEDYFCQKLSSFLPKFKSLTTKQRNLLHYDIVGSTRQGGFTASLFSFANHASNDVRKSMDIDVVFVINLTIHKECVREVDTKPGIVKILKNCSSIQKHEVYASSLNEEDFIFPYPWKEYLRKEFVRNNYKVLKEAIQFVKTNIYNVEYLDKIKIIPSYNVTKATIIQINEIYREEKLIFKLSVDFAQIFGLDYQPDYMTQFQARTNLKIPVELFKEAFIINKPSYEEKLDPNTTELSHSYYHLENYIMCHSSLKQKLVFLIFKTTACIWLKPLNPNIIKTYIFKTIYMWNLEKPQVFWKQKTMEIVRQLFKHLKICLERKYLPNFFIPQINLLKQFSFKLQIDVLRLVKRFLRSRTLINFLPNKAYFIAAKSVTHESGNIIKDLNAFSDILIEKPLQKTQRRRRRRRRRKQRKWRETKTKTTT